MGSGPSETKQWADMIAKPKQAAVVWHRCGTKKMNILIMMMKMKRMMMVIIYEKMITSHPLYMILMQAETRGLRGKHEIYC